MNDILFFSDAKGINDALSAQKPWLNCPLAGSESIFMVAVDGGSPDLEKLSIPEKAFKEMHSFEDTEVQDL
ncbi:unnamed protein product, partial [Anisakis simplex]|uniref:Glutamine amidotransferase n=1 Tax=Anisakis simplex TaxID=6269 RepID=A0A0M3JPQ7_ANISI